MYLDASAVVKLLVAEAETPALAEILHGQEIYSNALVAVELHRAVRRRGVDPEIVQPILDSLSLLEFSNSQLRVASSLPDQHLGALDAIHLASALILNADALITYDKQLASAALRAGMHSMAPA